MPFGAQGEFQAGGGSGSGGSSAPSGPAGGVLAGTYPNPSLSTTASGTTQSAGDTSTKLATDAFVATAITNALATINPAVAVLLSTTSAADTASLTYANGVAGVGATFTGTVNTPLTFDGTILTALGQRILVKDDTQSPSGAFNGVYFLSQLQTSILAPVLTRALDYDQPSDINNTGAIPVQSGTANAGNSYLLTSQVTTVGTSPLTYIQFTSSVATPSNLVVGLPTDTIVKISGLSGSPDRTPASPSSFNDEFDQNSAGTPSGWTAFNTATVLNTSDLKSHLHIVQATPGSGPNITGICKLSPTLPYTVTMKLSDSGIIASSNRAALFVSDIVPTASTGHILDWGIAQTTGSSPTGYSNAYTGWSGSGSTGGPGASVITRAPVYFRMIVAATFVTMQYSFTGIIWLGGATGAIPAATPAYVGLHCAPQSGSGQGEGYFDWIRFT